MKTRDGSVCRALVRACRVVMIACAAVTGGASAQPGPTIGLNQPVAVIVCKYRGEADPILSDGPAMTSALMAQRFDERINAYYLNSSARQGTLSQMSFDFREVPGICEFEYSYDDTAPGGAASLIPSWIDAGLADVNNDPQVMTREVPDAIRFADRANPGIFNTVKRVVVIVDRPKRARATGALPITGLSGSGLAVLSACLIDPGNANDFTPLAPGDAIPTTDFDVLCHELGHQLGLPDLYREDAIHGPGRDFVAHWCEMGSNAGQHFSSYCRHKLGWVPPARVRNVQPDLSTGFTFDGVIRLGPAGSNVGEADMVRINTSLPLMPFSGFHVEVRTRAATSRVDANLPSNYEPGVLITKISAVGDLTVGMAERPVFVQSRGQTADSLHDAAFRAGDADFFDPDTGVRVSVLAINLQTGEAQVRVRMTPPPRPDVFVSDIALDSPTNGFGSLTFPDLWGDSIDYSLVVRWQDNSPFPATPILPPDVTPINHRLRVTLRNNGNAGAAGVRAKVVFARPEIPASFDIANPASWSPLAIDEQDVNFGDMAPGDLVTRAVNYTPRGPFVAAVFIERPAGEMMVLNNFATESFVVQWLAFGSPYTPLRLETKVTNGNRHMNSVIVSPDSDEGIPPGWTASMDKVSAILEPGRDETFKLQVQPPDPSVRPPAGSSKDVHTITLVTSMNLSDTWVPVYKHEVHAVLSRPTKLTVECKGKAGEKLAIGGRLTFRASPDSASSSGLGNAPVAITVSGSDGTTAAISAMTGSDGKFSVSLPDTREGVQYIAVGRYGGGTGYAPAESDGQALCGAEAAPGRPPSGKVKLHGLKFSLPRELLTEKPVGIVTLSGPAPRGGAVVNLESSQPRTVIVPSAVRIPEGETSATFDVNLKRGAKPPRSVTISASYLSVTLRETYSR